LKCIKTKRFLKTKTLTTILFLNFFADAGEIKIGFTLTGFNKYLNQKNFFVEEMLTGVRGCQ